MPELRDRAFVHHGDARGNRQRLVLVMGHHDEGDADLALELRQLKAHGLAQFGIERRQRLVEQEHLRLLHQRARERNALALAARQLVGHARGQMTELDEIERLLHAPVALGLRHAVDLEAVGDIVGDRHMRKHGIGLKHHVHGAFVGRNLGHVLAVDQHVTLGRHFEAGEHAQQRGLAATGRSEQRKELAGRDVEADIVHGDRRAPALGDIAEADDRLERRTVADPLGPRYLLSAIFCPLPCIIIISAMSTMVTKISMVDAALTSGVTEKRTIE